VLDEPPVTNAGDEPTAIETRAGSPGSTPLPLDTAAVRVALASSDPVGWRAVSGPVSVSCRSYGSHVKEILMIGFIVAGLVIGALARLFKPGKQNLGLLATLLLGLAGSVIGGVIANLLGTGDIFELNVLGFIVAVIAAVLLIGVAEGLAGRRKGAA
jgi:uncharacterized membrane protein YeaQ/YmgE (transglycosylase-associated protein family)